MLDATERNRERPTTADVTTTHTVEVTLCQMLRARGSGAARGARAFFASARRLSTAAASDHYASITQADIDHFASIVGGSNVITDEGSLETYNLDWMRKYRGRSKLALRPGSTAEVSSVLAHCHARRIPLVPQGGNTGLVGGSVPVGEEVVLSLSGMSAVLALDEHAGNLVCEAGCVLETLQEHVAARGYTMPIDLGAKGSCQIGGNVATNAGGLRFLRYGSLHGSVLGLEARPAVLQS